MGWAAKAKAQARPKRAKERAEAGDKRRKRISMAEARINTVRDGGRFIPINEIKNKLKRRTVWGERKVKLNRLKGQAYQKRKNLRKKYGFQAAPYKIHTQEDKAVKDPTVVMAGDRQVEGEHAIDEFSGHFSNTVQPRICITTSMKPTRKTLEFINELLDVFPDSKYFTRRKFTIKQVNVQRDSLLLFSVHSVHDGLSRWKSMGNTLILKLFDLRCNSVHPDSHKSV